MGKRASKELVQTLLLFSAIAASFFAIEYVKSSSNLSGSIADSVMALIKIVGIWIPIIGIVLIWVIALLRKSGSSNVSENNRQQIISPKAPSFQVTTENKILSNPGHK